MTTIENITARLRSLSADMIQLGADMQFNHLPSEYFPHGTELVNAGRMAESWAEEIEAEYPAEQDCERVNP